LGIRFQEGANEGVFAGGGIERERDCVKWKKSGGGVVPPYDQEERGYQQEKSRQTRGRERKQRAAKKRWKTVRKAKKTKPTKAIKKKTQKRVCCGPPASKSDKVIVTIN